MHKYCLESSPRTFGFSSIAAEFYEIKKGEYRSTEVQKYSEKHENDFTYNTLKMYKNGTESTNKDNKNLI